MPNASILFCSASQWRLFQAMRCNFCDNDHPHSQWKDSQWDSWKQITSEFNCCKVCSSTPNSNRRASIEDLNAAYEEMRRIRRERELLWENRECFEDFIHGWMQKLSYDDRKRFSYKGAISAVKGRWKMIPQASVIPFCSAEKRLYPYGYFDPGNWVYKTSMRKLHRSFVYALPWSEDTWGDICEGILGLAFLYRTGQEPDLNRYFHAAFCDGPRLLRIAAWLDRYVRSIYVCCWVLQTLDPSPRVYALMDHGRSWRELVRECNRIPQI